MPDIEEIIEAVLRGRLGDTYDHLPKIELWRHRQATLEALTPALPVIEKIKARVWEEGVSQVMRDYHGGEPYKLRPNPYGGAI